MAGASALRHTSYFHCVSLNRNDMNVDTDDRGDVGIAQSIWRPRYGLALRGSNSGRGWKFSLLQVGLVAHTA